MLKPCIVRKEARLNTDSVIDREGDEGGSMSDNLKIALNKEGYLCDEKLASAVEACLHTRPTAGAFLFGPAGSGQMIAHGIFIAAPLFFSEILTVEMLLSSPHAKTKYFGSPVRGIDIRI